jgi:hypothetical protein
LAKLTAVRRASSLVSRSLTQPVRWLEASFGRCNVHRFGLAKVLVRINGDSFKELAQKMMEANSSDAIKAFSAALGG